MGCSKTVVGSHRKLKIYRKKKPGFYWHGWTVKDPTSYPKRKQRMHRHGQVKAFPVVPSPRPLSVSKGWAKWVVENHNSSDYCSFFYGFLQKCIHWLIWLVHIQVYSAFDFWRTAKEAALDTGHSATSISFTHPQNKNHKKVSMVKNIIKVINLKRTLRVFPLCLREKGNEQDLHLLIR